MANIANLPPSPPADWNEPEVPPSQDPVEAFILPVLRARYLILLCFVVGGSAGIVMALSKPNTYEAHGQLLLKVGKRESRTNEDVMDPDAQSGASGSALTDELEILRDRETVYRKMALQVGPDRILAAYDPTQDDSPSTSGLTKLLHRIQRWWFSRGMGDQEIDNTDELAVVSATTALEEGLKIDAIPRSRVIEIRYVANSPKLAQDVVASFLSNAQTRHSDVFSKAMDAGSELAKSEQELYRQQFDEAEKQLSQFALKNDIVDLEAQKAGLIASIDLAEESLGKDRQDLAQVKIRRQSLEQRHKLTARFEEVEVPSEPIPNKEYVAKEESIAFKKKIENFCVEEIKKGGLHADNQKRNLEIVREEIQELEAQLKTIDPTVLSVATTKTVPNPRYDEVLEKLEDATATQDGLVTSIRMAEEQLNERRTRLAQLGANESKYLELFMDSEQARTRLTSSTEVLEDIRRITKIDASNDLSNLMVIKEPSLPLKKAGPKRAILVAAGIACGLGFGVLIAFVLSFFDRRFRRPQDIERILGVKVLGVVPDAKRLSMTKRLH